MFKKLLILQCKNKMDIVKSFHTNKFSKEITIIGTVEQPLFKANDIADLLNMSNIRVVLADFDETEKCVSNAYTARGYKDINFLTEKGLYKLLFRSRKPIAIEFTNWVCEVIKDIRLNGVYQLEQQLKEKQDENINLMQQYQTLRNEVDNMKPIDGRPVIYIFDMDTRTIQPNGNKQIKIGISQNAHDRIKPYKQICPHGKVVFFVHIDTDNLRTTESWLSTILKPYHVKGEVFDISIEAAKKYILHVANTLELAANNNVSEAEAHISKIVDLENQLLNKSHLGVASCREISTQTEDDLLEKPDENEDTKDQIDMTSKFDTYVNECCLLDPLYEVSSKDIEGQYRLWARSAEKEVFHALNEYLRTRFRPIRIHTPQTSQNVHGYRGVKLIDFPTPPLPFAPSDPELFIAHACVYSPSSKTLMKDMLQEYEAWAVDINKQVKSCDLKDYLKNSQMVLTSNVWTINGNGHGYYGICLKKYMNTNKGTSTTGKRVSKRNENGDIVATWTTIAKAAEHEGMPAAAMSRVIKNRQIVDGFIFTVS